MKYWFYPSVLTFVVAGAGVASCDESDYTSGFADGYAAGYQAGGGGAQLNDHGVPFVGSGFPNGGGSYMEGFEKWFAETLDAGSLPDYLAIEVNEDAGLTYSKGAAKPFFLGVDDTVEMWSSLTMVGDAVGMTPGAGSRILLVPVQPLSEDDRSMTLRIIEAPGAPIKSIDANSTDWAKALRGFSVDTGGGVTLLEPGMIGLE